MANKNDLRNVDHGIKDLCGADLSGALLVNNDLSSITFETTNLQKAHLEGVNLDERIHD